MSVPPTSMTPGRGRVESGHEAEQRRLAAARRPDDGQELAVGHGQVQRMQDGEGTAAAVDGLRHVAQRDHSVVESSSARTIGSSTRHTVSATRAAPA